MIMETSHYSNEKNNYKHDTMRVDATVQLGTIEVPIDYKGKYLGNLQNITIGDIVELVRKAHKIPDATPIKINLIHFDKI